MGILGTILLVILIIIALAILITYLYTMYKLNQFKKKVKEKAFETIKNIAVETIKKQKK